MARLNTVQVMGIVMNEEIQPITIPSEKTGGNKKKEVLNFSIRVFDKEEGRYYTLPVAVWEEKMIDQCIVCMKKGDLVYVQGELRYKVVYDSQTKERVKSFETIKAQTIEFISKKVEDQEKNRVTEKQKQSLFLHSMNEVKLIGNLVHPPNDSERGFVVAVDRLYPSKEVTVSNDKLTDFVTLVLKDKEVIKGTFQKGSMVIIDGKVMKRKRNGHPGDPVLVVEVAEMVGS